MPARKGLLAPQNTFLDTIATRFDGTHSNFVLGNAQVPSIYPIVYCSDGFCEVTGFSRAQIMQKPCSCKFLYGPDTAEEHKQEIQQALDTKSELKLEVIFYKKSGTSFWCLLDLVPIKNEKREVVLFLASHKDITPLKLAAGLHEGKEVTSDPDDNDNYDPESPPVRKNANYARRRSRAVLYQLSGHYTQRRSKGKLNGSLLQPASVPPLPEYKTAALPKSNFVVSHYGTFKSCWDWLMLIATFYVAVIVPYNAAFLQQDRSSLIGDVLVEVLFILDVLLNFRTTFVNRKGEVVSNPKAIAIHYLRSWFVVDMLSALPFDTLLASSIYQGDVSHIHLLKLFRLIRLARLLQKLERYAQYSAMVLTLLMLVFTLVAHWLACIWYLIAERDKALHGDDWNLGWLHILAERMNVSVTNVSLSDSYLTALYFTCSSLTSVGFGNVSANTGLEKVFSICTMLIGALMHAAVFGNVTAIIQRMYLRRSLYQSRWRDLKDFIGLHQIPKQLKQRMEDYFQTMWSLHHGIDVHEVLREFPEELRGDICMHLHREVLQLPLFELASQGCMKLLSEHIKANFCAPGEYLLHRGDALHYIYYLCNGSMEVVQNDMVVAILGKGDLVGSDINIHLAEGGVGDIVVRSSSDVRALTYCDLKSISITGLLEVLRLYPEFQEQFATDIQHDLTFNLRDGYEAEDLEECQMKSQTLPSISEDDEGTIDGSRTPSPGSPKCASPLINLKPSADESTSPKPSLLPCQKSSKSRELLLLRPVLGWPPAQARSMEFLNVEVDHTRTSVERLDHQVTVLQQDIGSLGHEVRSTLSSLQKLQCELHASITLWNGFEEKGTQTEPCIGTEKMISPTRDVKTGDAMALNEASATLTEPVRSPLRAESFQNISPPSSQRLSSELTWSSQSLPIETTQHHVPTTPPHMDERPSSAHREKALIFPQVLINGLPTEVSEVIESTKVNQRRMSNPIIKNHGSNGSTGMTRPKCVKKVTIGDGEVVRYPSQDAVTKMAPDYFQKQQYYSATDIHNPLKPICNNKRDVKEPSGKNKPFPFMFPDNWLVPRTQPATLSDSKEPLLSPCPSPKPTPPTEITDLRTGGKK